MLPFLAGFKAIFFDLFDTLVIVEMDRDKAFEILFSGLVDEGFSLSHDEFKTRYVSCRERLRKKSIATLREHTNSLAIAEAMNLCGIKVDSEDSRLTRVIDAQFAPFIKSTRPLSGALDLLKSCHKQFRVGLITNFTYAPVVRRLLKALAIDYYLDSIIISDEIGYRKPHAKIFRSALKELHVTAKESIMVGDNILEDISGAKRVGMGTVLLLRKKSKEEPSLPRRDLSPDKTVTKLSELMKEM